MPKALADDLRVDTLAEHQRGRSVSKIVVPGPTYFGALEQGIEVLTRQVADVYGAAITIREQEVAIFPRDRCRQSFLDLATTMSA